MSENNDGGPAVPLIEALVAFENSEQRGYYTESSGGMSLRDYFAGQALVNLTTTGHRLHDAARVAYEYADAMLKARESQS